MRNCFVVMLFVGHGLFGAVGEEKKNLYDPNHAPETAVEDLAGEHGLVERLLLIYDEIGRRLRHDDPFELADLAQAATIIRSFVEDYHEKTEENYVFPVLEKKGVAVSMIAELRKQHTAGRMLTSRILELVQQDNKIMYNKRELRKLLKKFVTMYRVHLSREDADVFPLFRKLISQEEYTYLGSLFDQVEQQRVGKHGLRKFLQQVEEIEKRLDIFDISYVTPTE